MKLEVKNLQKSFKKNKVINNISITFESGKIYGLSGRNGSGKSVFLKLICSFYIPDEGEILLDGYNYISNNDFLPNARALIENPDFISDITGFENLKLLASIQGKINDDVIIDFLKNFSLYDQKDKKYSEYSIGMKQKLGIIQVLMENPDIIILDEPFNGVDESSVNKIKKYILNLKKQNKLIIISSHIKNDLKELCDEIYNFDNGSIKKEK